MFCPICGVEIEKLIEYNGSKVCPKCGCVVEKSEKAVPVVNEITLSKEMSAARIIAIAGIIFSLLSMFSKDISSTEFLLYILPVILIDVLCIIGYKFKNGKTFNIAVSLVLGFLSFLLLFPFFLLFPVVRDFGYWTREISYFVDDLLYPEQDWLILIKISFLITSICFVLIALFVLFRKKAIGSISVAVVTLFGICCLIHEIRCAIIYGQFELSMLYYCSLPCMTMIYSIFLYVLDSKKQGEGESKAAESAEINQKKIKIAALCTAVIVIAGIGLAVAYKPVKQSLNYKKAVAMFDSGNYDEASLLFEALGDYKDSSEMINEAKYHQAVEYKNNEAYEDALTLFEELGDYKDSSEMINEVKYKQAVKYNDSGAHEEALALFAELDDYKDSNEYYIKAWQSPLRTIDSSVLTTVGIEKYGGGVVAFFDFDDDDYYYHQDQMYDWHDIVSVAAGVFHTVGLKEDGTVVAVGNNEYGQCEVSGWKNIVSISAGAYHTVGLKEDGTVVAVGNNKYGQCKVSGWKDIVSVSAGVYHTVGLKKDGTVVAVGDNEYGQCKVSGWKDIVSVSAGVYHTVGLKKDGTVVAVGYNEDGQCKVSGWKNIVSVSGGDFHTVGLKKDGTVVAVGGNVYGQCKVSGWKNIVSISAGDFYTVGLKKDGTVVVSGEKSASEYIQSWNIKTPSFD